MTLEEAKKAAENKSRIILTLPMMPGVKMSFTADEAGEFRRRGGACQYIRLVDSVGCVVIANPKDCRLEEKDENL